MEQVRDVNWPVFAFSEGELLVFRSTRRLIVPQEPYDIYKVYDREGYPIRITRQLRVVARWWQYAPIETMAEHASPEPDEAGFRAQLEQLLELEEPSPNSTLELMFEALVRFGFAD